LKKYNLNRKKVAVELNGKILPQNKYDSKKLKNNDKVEIVQFIGGG
jgi:thiamine biosynthesis protein ThiS